VSDFFFWVIGVSHISLIKTRLKNVNKELLRQAVLALANELGAEVVDEITNYYGHRYKVFIGIRSTEIPHGIGFYVDSKGNVQLKGDFYGVSRLTEEKIERGLVRHYIAIATATALRNMGYQVSARSIKEHIYIKAVGW